MSSILFKGMTLKQADQAWAEMEDRIAQYVADERRLQNAYKSALSDQYKALLNRQIGFMQAQSKKWLAEQQELESFLIENEAEGWTST